MLFVDVIVAALIRILDQGMRVSLGRVSGSFRLSMLTCICMRV